MPTQRPVTMVDVARRAGVSRALVSIVLRDAPGASASTRAHVRAVAAELGYVPDARAQGLRNRTTPALGVAFQPAQRFHAAIIDGIYRHASAAGVRVVLSAVTGAHDEATATDALLSNRCGAIITLGTRLSRPKLIELAQRIPVIVVATPVRGPGIESVCSDDAEGLELAVDHLAGLGHENIWFCSSPGSGGNRQRIEGYRRAMTRLGFAGRIRILDAGSDEEGGARAAREILSATDRPTGVIGFNDPCAAGLQDVLTAHRLDIPHDISLMGFDDSEVASVSYRQLTTVRQHIDELSRLATERALARVGGEEARARIHTVKTSLTVRSTTAAHGS